MVERLQQGTGDSVRLTADDVRVLVELIDRTGAPEFNVALPGFALRVRKSGGADDDPARGASE